MFLPDFNIVLEELLQLALTVASLKHLAGLVVAEETRRQNVSDEPEEVVQPHRPSDDPEIDDSVNRSQFENEPKNESTAANEKVENNSSMTSHNENLLEDVESPEIPSKEEIELPPLPPGKEFEETNFASIASHELTPSPEDTIPFASSVAHHLIPCQVEDYEVSMAVHQVEREVYETEEVDKELEEVADTSMAAHKLSEMEPKSDFASLPMSLTTHHLLPVEFPEMGLFSSMVAHQIYQPHPENIEESVPQTTSLDCESNAQELKEDIIEDNLRENLKVWFMGIDFKATYGTSEEDESEDSGVNYDIPIGFDQIEHEDKAVEEVETEPDNSNIVHKLPKIQEKEEEEVAEEADTSMAAHKLSEMDTMSEFLSVPTSLASHHLLPVEWPETGILSSMVAHQIYQPRPENIEETVPLTTSLDCESNAQELNEDTFEENLRENLKVLYMGIDFKATYGTSEEDEREDSGVNYEIPIDVDHADKAVEENVEEVETEPDDSNIVHKLPKIQEEEDVAKEGDTTMAAHKLSEMETKSEFLSFPTSLASHHVFPMEWPETGILTSMVAHQIFHPCPEDLDRTVPLTASLDPESINAEELNEDTFEENLRENLKIWFMGIDFKATYGDSEEYQPEDSGENASMDYEIPTGVDQIEHEDKAVEENVEDVETEPDDSSKLPKMDKEEYVTEEADTSMVSHKLPEMEPESEFPSLPASLASHLLLAVEWPETGLPTSMVAHQIYHPCPENLEENVLLTPNIDFEASNPHLSKEEANEVHEMELEENLRKDFEKRLYGVDFKATYCHLEEETTLAEESKETLLLVDQKDSVEISPSESEPEQVHESLPDEDHTRENISEVVVDKFSMEETLKTHITKNASREWEDYAEPEAWVSMVGHQIVGAEKESELPFASMAAHHSHIPEWREEGTVSSCVSHQVVNQQEVEEENVPEKWEENVFEPFVSASNQIPVAESEKDVSLSTRNLPDIKEVEETSTEKHQERGVREAEVCKIREEAEKDPRRRNIEPATPKSPVGTSDDEKASFENFINESKQTYHERVADEYKSRIKRIQDLHKLVEEEIGEFDKSRKDIKKSEVITVTSNVRGVSFPLEITINQTNQKEDFSEAEKMQGCQKEEEEEVEEAESPDEGGDDDSENIISATCTLRENTPILITTNMDHVECDSGFEGSPDLKNTDGVRNLELPSTEAESPLSFPRQTLTTPKRSSVEEKKIRDRQLLESFLRNENHEQGQKQIKEKTTVTGNSVGRVTPEKKHVPKMPEIPVAQEAKEAKKQKNRKPKVTTTAFKDSIMKKTYKIRFHVNLKEAESEKPRSVLETFLSFFKDRSIFGKK